MADDFFEEKPQVETAPEQPEETKIKLGDREFSEKEASDLIRLGEIARESEEKYDRPISKYWPDYTKTKNELASLKEELARRDEAPAMTTPVGEMTPAQAKAQAIKQAEELGLLHTGNVQQYIDQRIEAHNLMQETERLVGKVAAEGKPTTTVDAILEHMVETGIKSPEKAYKDMYETQLDAWKENQLKKVKPEGLTTQETSSAGSKAPETLSIKSENDLRNSLNSLLNSSAGLEKS